LEPGADITQVRGSAVRCYGPPEAAHDEAVIDIPAREVVRCPECGRLFCRTALWNALSGAIWPGPP
jgi:hypothetical protein